MNLLSRSTSRALVAAQRVTTGRTAHATGHPPWCALGHHCTADRIGGAGEHASIPEIWQTSTGRIVATRYQRADRTRDRVEIRAVVDVDPGDDIAAQETARLAITAVYAALTHVRDVLGAAQ